MRAAPHLGIMELAARGVKPIAWAGPRQVTARSLPGHCQVSARSAHVFCCWQTHDMQ
ncbi:MAG: hypothetical protein OJF49_000474 [Ktedonobacterales bacterium]|nr:MAG: hypothetical protein OJF49_000474 [Ktedonobacterales bacterium]